MIRHNVFFKVKPGVSKDAIDNAFQLLFKLQNQLPGILTITGGESHFLDGKSAGHFSHGFSIDFADSEAYSNFLESNLAGPAKGCILNITEGGMEGIMGFDIGDTAQLQPAPRRRISAPRLRLVQPGGMY